MPRNDNTTGPRPDARSLDILDAVVRLHAETGRPVSSALVRRSLPAAPSPATIRSIMRRLEEAGYLEQPHTSAGRLPTDLGYRCHVDRLYAAWPLRRYDMPTQMVDAARRAAPAPEGQNRIRDLARLLSLLTQNISIVLGPTLEQVRVSRLECYPREGGRILLVLILDNGQVRTRLVALPDSFPAAVLDEAAALLDRRLRGRSLGEVRAERLATVDFMDTPASRCVTELAGGALALVDEIEDQEVEMEGVGRLLAEPEFQDAEPLKALIRFLESPREILGALRRYYRHEEDGFGVWIGAENPLSSLQGFTMITGTMEMSEGQGLLAVLGPRRLFYQRTFQGLEILRRIGGGHDPALSH